MNGGVCMNKVILRLVLTVVASVFLLSGCGNVQVNVPAMSEIQLVGFEEAIQDTPQFTPAKDQKVIAALLDDLGKAQVIGKAGGDNRSPVVVMILLKDGTEIRFAPEYQSDKPVTNRIFYLPNGKLPGLILESVSLWDWLNGGWTKFSTHP